MLQHKVSRCRVVLEVCLLVTVCILVYIQVSSWRTERTTKVSQHHDLRNSLEYKEYHYQSGDMDSTMSRNSATSIHKYKDDRSGEEDEAALAPAYQETRRKQKPVSNKNFWDWSYERKSEFQRKQVEKYCKMHGLDNQTAIPVARILLHKEKEVAFCYIPKSACTTFKILLLHTQGLLPDDYLNYSKTMQPYLAPQLQKITLGSLGKRNHGMVMSNYFKFVMFRHPLERLLSGYRSKMSVAMKTDLPEGERDVQSSMLLDNKRELISQAYPKEYKKWEASHESYPVNISFSDFIDYWLTSKRVSRHSHFDTLLNLCKPCSIRYNYYGNFRTFKEDAHILMDRIDAEDDELRPQYPEPSDTLIDEYYSQLSTAQKMKIVEKLAPDLELYYMLFPPEADSHKRMLRINK